MTIIDAESKRPNCYECKFRGEVPGSAHSSCHHPAFAKVQSDPLLGLMSMLGPRGDAFQVSSDECKVVGNPHGIRRGWFNHPFNFDPTWLQSCTGYEAKP